MPARPSCALGVAEVDGREAVRVGKGLDGVFQTVTVGIRLDDRPERAAGGACAHAREIVFQRLNINFGIDGTWHSVLPKSCEAPERRGVRGSSA